MNLTPLVCMFDFNLTFLSLPQNFMIKVSFLKFF